MPAGHRAWAGRPRPDVGSGGAYWRAGALRRMNKVAVVADDHEIVRDALSAILVRRFGFARICEAGTMDEVLSRLKDTPQTRLVLMDLDMPGVEVASSVAMVRRDHPSVKLAVVSASQRRHDILTALAAGAHGYITKSLGTAAVGDALAIILNGEVYVPPTLAEPEVVVPDAEISSNPGAAGLLTRRQTEVLSLLVEGRSNKDIARQLNLGEGTVKTHVAVILQRLGVASRSAAAAIGARLEPTSRT